MAVPSNSPAEPEVPLTFDQAAALALEEHSTPGDADPDAEADADADDDADPDDEHADADGDDSSQDDDDDDDAEPDAAAGDDGKKKTTPGKESTSVLSDAEVKALQTKHANDPDGLLKAYNKAFTTKTQALAQERKGVERYTQYADMLDAYETDPNSAILALAEAHGLTLGKLPPAGERKVDEKLAPTLAESLAADVKAELGDDLDYLADPITKVLAKILEKHVPDLANKSIDAKVKPIADEADRRAMADAIASTNTQMDTFRTSHPDVDEAVEAAMLKVGEKLQPTAGMPVDEYLEILYAAATRGTAKETYEARVETDVTARLAKRLKKIAKGAEDGRSGRESVPDGQVRKGFSGGRLPTFDEAAEAAKRGERFD